MQRARRNRTGGVATTRQPAGDSNLHCGPLGVGQVEVDCAVVLCKAGVDGMLGRAEQGAAFKHPERIL
jgi:hypothetical protein